MTGPDWTEATALTIVAFWLLLFIRQEVARRRLPVVIPNSALRSTPGLPASVPASATPKVTPGRLTGFMPARDEREVIGASLNMLLAQGDILSSLVVIDDGSTDGTLEVIQNLSLLDRRVVVLQACELHPGECGKPAALWQAVTACPPRTEWLIFADADVEVAAGALDALVHLAESREVDLLSVLPKVELVRPFERLFMPSVLALVLSRFPADQVNDPHHAAAFANGQLLLVRRTAYEHVGGHARVAGEILEDVALAKIFKREGFKILLVDGRHLAKTRMYSTWSEFVEGWSKNLFLLAGARVPAALRAAFTTLALAFSPLVVLSAGWPVGFGAYVLIVALQIQLRRRIDARALWSFLAPLAGLVASWLLVRSTWLHARKGSGGVRWKGRRYEGAA